MQIRKFDDRTVVMTDKQAETITCLEQVQKGGFATIHGYRPSTNVIDQPVYDVQILSRFSYERLNKRKLEALQGVKFDDVRSHLNAPKLKALTEQEQIELFNERMEQAQASIMKSLEGDRSDAHRQGHDRCYIKIAMGVTGHLLTEKGPDGLKYPVLDSNGHAILESIMLDALEINRKIITEGSYKTVNSGAPVLMSKAIMQVLNSRSVGMKRFSLKADNFDAVSIGGKIINPSPLIEQLVA